MCLVNEVSPTETTNSQQRVERDPLKLCLFIWSVYYLFLFCFIFIFKWDLYFMVSR